MSTFKNVKHFRIVFWGNPLTEDKSLVSLCKTNVSLSSLKLFVYESGQHFSLRNSPFVCLNHLERLYLLGSHIHIEDFAFQGLHHLQELFLQTPGWNSSGMTPELLISQSAFKGLSGLQSLIVTAPLYVLKPEVFVDISNVKMLDFTACKIQVIEDFAFKNLSEVRHMDLRMNKISKLTKNTFFGLQTLESLMLEHNPLMHLEAECFAHLPSLRILHLGNLKLPNTEPFGMQVLNLSLIFGGFPRNLSELTITSAVRPMTLVIADDSTPDVDLSLTLSGQKIVLWGCSRPFLQSVTKLYVVTDLFICAPQHTVALCHFTSVVSLDFSQVHSSTIQSLSCLNRLVNLKSLDIERVNFINDPGVSHMFHNLTQLQIFTLSQCWLDSLEGELSLDLTSLEYFFIDSIETEVSFTTGFFEHLTSLKSAIVSEVKLRCTCDNMWFLHWARNKQQTEVFMSNPLDNPLQCLSGGGLQDLDSYGQAHCWMWGLDVGFVLFVSTLCFLLLFMTVVLLHQLAKDYLQAFYHIAHGWLNEALRHHQNTRGRYLHDAFVSYSGRDERWVMEELLPNLERRGPPFLKLCLHSRDFQLGKDIVENITDSLYRSRRTLCLVSRHYLRSNWCSLEMRLGTYRLQVEHRDVLILVFLEKIPSNLLSAHHRLARLVKTRTYIEWPQDPAQQEAFWERLWKKLLPDRVQ
ncbi:toll-like receptor 13 [Sardina pilchardus]|uniref:toll-like receptor 13 n=1 Tax=Sardina pilchardus TaxID=27697 RepID=UPI002E111EA4